MQQLKLFSDPEPQVADRDPNLSFVYSGRLGRCLTWAELQAFNDWMKKALEASKKGERIPPYPFEEEQ